jgi:hypothetical protein
MSDEQRQRLRQTIELAVQAPPGLTIVETDSSVTLAPDSGTALALRSDGRKVTQKVDGGGDVEIKGRWQGNDFVIERKVAGGGRVTEDYLRSQDGKQLYVIVDFDGGRGRSLTFRRVYDAAPAP